MSRNAIVALRPAPIQVNYLGYPGTMGASFMDIPSAMVAVRLVDNVASFAGAAQKFLEHGAILPPAWQ